MPVNRANRFAFGLFFFFKETTLSELNLRLFLTGYWPEERRRSVGIYFPQYFLLQSVGLKLAIGCFGQHNIVAFDAF